MPTLFGVLEKGLTVAAADGGSSSKKLQPSDSAKRTIVLDVFSFPLASNGSLLIETACLPTMDKSLPDLNFGANQVLLRCTGCYFHSLSLAALSCVLAV